MSQPKTWFVVGASRGIGFEFVKQALERGDRAFATVRNPEAKHEASYWTKNTNVKPEQCMTLACDVLSEKSIDDCIRALSDTGCSRIDHAIINAGVLKYPNRATEISYDDFAFHLHSNTIGPVICAQRLLQTKVSIGSITFISSDSASGTQFNSYEDGFGAYGASKAALNQMARHMAEELKRKSKPTTILMLHPGEVNTDMATNIELPWEIEAEQLSPEDSVRACVNTIESKGPQDTGSFWTWDNRTHPW
ncbi:hypothetical protein LTR78_010684 [Recurvomyces mirabilis]|uniref:Oxidoreductase n=1 Tax=Recurvomyces mirabilis TaxID=574656 RepID=A0AAE0TMR9_9PEZI|nr:hypothetical protein LTR78_010684 [Recurvomyces mirabilis]KAK5158235.1 hypothetical protein LTS14_003253 [Recurvomyces mirabilis]